MIKCIYIKTVSKLTNDNFVHLKKTMICSAAQVFFCTLAHFPVPME